MPGRRRARFGPGTTRNAGANELTPVNVVHDKPKSKGKVFGSSLPSYMRPTAAAVSAQSPLKHDYVVCSQPTIYMEQQPAWCVLNGCAISTPKPCSQQHAGRQHVSHFRQDDMQCMLGRVMHVRAVASAHCRIPIGNTVPVRNTSACHQQSSFQ